MVARGGIHIIDLEQTIPIIRRALSLVQRTSNQRGKIYLISQKNKHTMAETQQFIPEVLFLLSIRRGAVLLRKGIKSQIPIIAICSGDVDISGINIPVPANDTLGVYKELALGAIFSCDESELKSLTPFALEF